jgi:hypothetical protein
MNNNFVCQTIDIPNFENIYAELLSYTLDQLPRFKEAFNHLSLQDMMKNCPLTNEWFTSVNLKPRVCALIIQPVGANIKGTHTDTQSNALALNFGIKNTKNTHTSFYKVVSGNIIQKTLPNGITWDNYEQAQLEEIARVDLQKPTIINTKIPHAVHNSTDEPRVSISFRFVEDPYHLINV